VDPSEEVKSEAANVKIIGNTKTDTKSMEQVIKLISGLVVNYLLAQDKEEPKIWP
jgi:hypothetical protein